MQSDSLTCSGHGEVRLSLQTFANISVVITYNAVVNVVFADFINDNAIENIGK